jgi:hypothetical protein
MRKAESKAIEPQLVPSEEHELARIIPIRSETTLTRYPVHRIAKKGTVKIKQVKHNERGKVITTWEVKNPPGPLAYKLDTIVINRRIDEMRNRGDIQKLIKLGSLRDICEELGINPSGKNTNAVREALHENGSAYIRANLDYTGTNGAGRTFEFGTSRYAVILTGEELPNGKKADAVYVQLHDMFLSLLEHSKTRPLDYEYLKELPPAAQRLYELLSFAIFGALRHGRPNAQMLYSEFCMSAPLSRHSEFYRVRSQMRKIHKPHIDSGYLRSIVFEETVDEAGLIDWVMKYTPGRKAKHEFKQFTTKKLNTPISRPRLVSGPSAQSQVQGDLFTMSQEDAALLSQLCSIGIVEKKAAELVRDRRESVERELEAWSHRDKSKMKDPAAWLIKAIESGDYSQPQKVETKRAQRIAAQKQQAREATRQRLASDYNAYLSGELDTLRTEHEEAYEVFCEEFTQFWDLACFDLTKDKREMMRLSFFEKFAEENPGLEVLTFWQWVENEKPEDNEGKQNLGRTTTLPNTLT